MAAVSGHGNYGGKVPSFLSGSTARDESLLSGCSRCIVDGIDIASLSNRALKSATD